MMNYRLLKYLFALSFLFLSEASFAGKYDVMLGAYSFTAKVSSKTTKLSGIGTYELAYLHPITDHLEFNLGYSLTMTGVIGGDYSYGPKIGINYYPFNFASNEKIILANKTIEIQDFYKPYIGIAFNQRQYQSAKSAFAGLGLSIGCEKYINPKYTVKTEVKMNTYTGASQAEASEVNVLFGLVLGF